MYNGHSPYTIRGYGLDIEDIYPLVIEERMHMFQGFLNALSWSSSEVAFSDDFDATMVKIMVKNCDRFVRVDTSSNGRSYLYFEARLPWEYPQEYWDITHVTIIKMLYSALKPVLDSDIDISEFSKFCFFVEDVLN